MNHPAVEHPLRAWRLSAGFSGLRLADALDVSSSLITEWEKGTRTPGFQLAVAIEIKSEGKVPIETWGYRFEGISELVRLRQKAA